METADIIAYLKAWLTSLPYGHPVAEKIKELIELTEKEDKQEIMNNTETEDTNRRTGRSTRQADELIQELFEKETIFFKDHHGTSGATHCLARKIVCRMKLEHDRPLYIKQFGPIYGITIKFNEGHDEKAFMHLNNEFQKNKI